MQTGPSALAVGEESKAPVSYSLEWVMEQTQKLLLETQRQLQKFQEENIQLKANAQDAICAQAVIARELAEVKSENADIRAKLHALEEENLRLKVAVDILEAQKKELETQKKKLETQKKELEAQKKEPERESLFWKTRLQLAEIPGQMLLAENSDLKNIIKRLESENQQAQETIAALNESVRTLTSEKVERHTPPLTIMYGSAAQESAPPPESEIESRITTMKIS